LAGQWREVIFLGSDGKGWIRRRALAEAGACLEACSTSSQRSLARQARGMSCTVRLTQTCDSPRFRLPAGAPSWRELPVGAFRPECQVLSLCRVHPSCTSNLEPCSHFNSTFLRAASYRTASRHGLDISDISDLLNLCLVVAGPHGSWTITQLSTHLEETSGPSDNPLYARRHPSPASTPARAFTVATPLTQGLYQSSGKPTSHGSADMDGLSQPQDLASRLLPLHPTALLTGRK
jgi:hypothetical protein